MLGSAVRGARIARGSDANRDQGTNSGEYVAVELYCLIIQSLASIAQGMMRVEGCAHSEIDHHESTDARH